MVRWRLQYPHNVSVVLILLSEFVPRIARARSPGGLILAWPWCVVVLGRGEISVTLVRFTDATLGVVAARGFISSTCL